MSRFRSAISLCRYLRPTNGRFLPLQTPITAGLSAEDRSTCTDPAGVQQHGWRSPINLTCTSLRGFATLSDDPTALTGKRASEAMAILRVYAQFLKGCGL